MAYTIHRNEAEDTLVTTEEKLREALQNCLGFLDTPIARRKIGLDPSTEWLVEARELAQEPNSKKSMMDLIRESIKPNKILDEIPVVEVKGPIPYAYGGFTGRTPADRPNGPVFTDDANVRISEALRKPADAGTGRFTDLPLPEVGDRVVWTEDPDPTTSLKGVKGTVVAVFPNGAHPHFTVVPDDWPGARIYSTWHSVERVRNE